MGGSKKSQKIYINPAEKDDGVTNDEVAFVEDGWSGDSAFGYVD